LQLRNYSDHTIYSYIGAAERFARHFGKSPTELGADHVKQFLLFLKNEKKVVWQTVQANRAALRFLYVNVLKQKWFEEEIPPPIRRPTLQRSSALKRSRACWTSLQT
jgi:integrase/recombinase XerD